MTRALCMLTLALSIPLLNGGCATVVSGTSQAITLSSEPSGATVTVQPGDITAQTPTEIYLKRNEAYTVQLEKPGYQPVSMELKRTLNWWTLGNVVGGWWVGVPAAIMDLTTGGAFRLRPGSVEVTLKPS